MHVRQGGHKLADHKAACTTGVRSWGTARKGVRPPGVGWRTRRLVHGAHRQQLRVQVALLAVLEHQEQRVLAVRARGRTGEGSMVITSEGRALPLANLARKERAAPHALGKGAKQPAHVGVAQALHYFHLPANGRIELVLPRALHVKLLERKLAPVAQRAPLSNKLGVAGSSQGEERSSQPSAAHVGRERGQQRHRTERWQTTRCPDPAQRQSQRTSHPLSWSAAHPLTCPAVVGSGAGLR